MVELKCIPITHTYTMLLHAFDCVKGTSIRSSVALNCTIKNDDDDDIKVHPTVKHQES